jgi:hypothetical protein
VAAMRSLGYEPDAELSRNSWISSIDYSGSSSTLRPRCSAVRPR